MKTTHTISINENPFICANTVSAKRVSTSRQYGACVVATATEALVAFRAKRLADDQAALVKATADLVALTAQYGMTVEEAQKKNEAEARTWFDLRSATRRSLQEGKGYIPGLDNIVDAKLQEAGHGNPYAAGTYYDICTTARQIEILNHSIERFSKKVSAGDQLVVTWSRDAGLAQKALASNAKYYCKDGHYTLAVRTDITVTSK